MMNVQLDAARASELLIALEAQLRAAGDTFDLVIIGGSALLALDLVQRTTRDVDVVAITADGRLIGAAPLPTNLQHARDRVARDHRVPADWLNSGPASLMQFGLPDGFQDRWRTDVLGPALTIRWASRLDQIHLKLFAAVDQSGKHIQDLLALQPTRDELLQAARWARQHDPSEAFKTILLEALTYFGARDAELD